MNIEISNNESVTLMFTLAILYFCCIVTCLPFLSAGNSGVCTMTIAEICAETKRVVIASTDFIIFMRTPLEKFGRWEIKISPRILIEKYS